MTTLSLFLCCNDLYLSEVAPKKFNSLIIRFEKLSEMLKTTPPAKNFNSIIGKVECVVATYSKKIKVVSELFHELYNLHWNSFTVIDNANNALRFGTHTPTHQTLLRRLLSDSTRSWNILSFRDQGIYTSVYQAFEQIIRDTEKVLEYINEENKETEMSTLQNLFNNITKNGYYKGKSAGDAVVQFTKELLTVAKDKSVGALKRECEALQEWKKSPEYLRETPGEKPCAFITDAEAAAAAKVAAKVPSLANSGPIVSGVVSALPSSKGSSQARSVTTPVVRPSSKSPVRADRSVPRSSGTASRVGTASLTRTGSTGALSSSRSAAGSVPKSRTTAAGSSPQRLPPRSPATQGAKTDCTEEDSATARKMVAKRAVVPSANNQSPIASLGRSSVRIVPGKEVKNVGVKGVINKGALGSDKPRDMCSSLSGGLKTNKAPSVVRGRANSPAVGAVTGRLTSKSPAPTRRTATAVTTSAKPSAKSSGRATHKVANGNATSHLSTVANKARSDSPSSSSLGNKVNSGARTNEQSPILRKVLKSDQQPKTSATVEKTKVLKPTATVRPASPVRAGSKSGTTSVAVVSKVTKAADKTAASTVATPPRTLRSAAGSPSTTRAATSSGVVAAGTGGAKSSVAKQSAKQSAKQAGEKKDAAVAGLGGCGAAAGKTGKKGIK